MSLGDADRRLLRFFLSCVLGKWDEVERVRRSAGPGEPDRRWREALLMVHLFGGVPRQVESGALLAAAGGLGDPEPDEIEPEPGESKTEPGEIQIAPGEIQLAPGESQAAPGQNKTARGAIGNGSDSLARGSALFDRIYGDDSAAVRRMLARGHPEFERWVLGHAYGRVLSRPGLAADRRELLAVVALAALGQDRQLAGHARGAIRCGATRAEIEGALASVADLIEAQSPGRVDSARRLVALLS